MRVNEMKPNKKQHTVAQVLQRQFVGPDGLLYCLDKQTLAIHTRGNTPKDILKGRNTYTSPAFDFDARINRPLENDYNKFLARVRQGGSIALNQEPDRAFAANWCAHMAGRSRFLHRVCTLQGNGFHERWPTEFACPKDAELLMLAEASAEYRRRFEKDQVEFRLMQSDVANAVLLTDHPVVFWPSRKQNESGVVLVPVTHDQIILVVPRFLSNDVVNNFEWRQIVLWQCAWAERLIYSGNLAVLNHVRSELESLSSERDGPLALRARQAFCGFVPEEVSANLH